MQSLTVNLGARSYPIHIGAGLLEQTGELLRQAGLRGKVAIVTNPVVAQLYLDPVYDALRHAGFDVAPVLVPDGEEHKNLASLATIYDRLIAERLERKSCVLALGGGVIGDLAGLAAATYLRGIPYAQVPTTLLAQVDSSVGGKTAVNHAGRQKSDRRVLSTQTGRDRYRRAALAAETGIDRRARGSDQIRHHRRPAPVFSARETPWSTLSGSIRNCSHKSSRPPARSKRASSRWTSARTIYRAVLNFGHTIGHALEAATGYRRFLHGEAVGDRHGQSGGALGQPRTCATRRASSGSPLWWKKPGLPVAIPAEVSLRSLDSGDGDR